MAGIHPDNEEEEKHEQGADEREFAAGAGVHRRVNEALCIERRALALAPRLCSTQSYNFVPYHDTVHPAAGGTGRLATVLPFDWRRGAVLHLIPGPFPGREGESVRMRAAAVSGGSGQRDGL